MMIAIIVLQVITLLALGGALVGITQELGDMNERLLDVRDAQRHAAATDDDFTERLDAITERQRELRIYVQEAVARLPKKRNVKRKDTLGTGTHTINLHPTKRGEQ